MGLNWVRVEVDLQGSKITGLKLDSLQLCANRHCDFLFDNGIIGVGSLQGFGKNSLFRSIHFQSSESPVVFSNCECDLEGCLSTSGLHMSDDCNIRIAKSVFQGNTHDGLVVDCGSVVNLSNCEFLGSGKFGSRTQNGGRTCLERCLFNDAGIDVEGSDSFCNIRNSVVSGTNAEFTVHHGAHMVMDGTVISDHEGNGLSVWGRGTRATLSSCEIQRPGNNGISVSNGAHIVFLNSKCVNAVGFGISVHGPGAKMKCQNSQIIDCNSGGVWIGERGIGVVTDSCIVGSANGFGILAEGYATELNLLSSQLSQHHQSCIILRKGAFARLKNVCSLASGTAHALEAHDESTIVQVTNGEYKSRIQPPIVETNDAILVHF